MHLDAVSGFLTILLIQFGSMLVGAVFHEFAHGWVAFRMGDTTARDAGRLTLNPLAHIDLVTTVIVPIVLFIAGMPPLIMFKPVPVNVRNIPNPRLGSLLVSLAGPLMNVLLAVTAALLFRVLVPAESSKLLQYAVACFVTINLVFAFFNLLPFPPLDGSHILESFLPEGALRFFYGIRTYLLIGFLILVFTPLFGFIWRPVRHLLYDLQILLTGIRLVVF